MHRRGSGEGKGRVRVSAGLRLTESVTLVTTAVVRDTLSDCHFSAWSRPKPAPDPLPGPSVASGVIPTKGGRNGPVPATSGRAPQGRWRSSPWKRCNHAAPRSGVREHPAPLGALRHGLPHDSVPQVRVREHPAPLGALRPDLPVGCVGHLSGQGAPRTARCIKAPAPTRSASVRPAGRGAPCSLMARFCPVRATGNSCVDGTRLTVRRDLLPFAARIRMLLCGTSDNLPPVCWPGSCACRNLRIRTTGTPCRAGAQASDPRGHWAHKGANGVGSALILRLRQNRPPTTAEAVHSPPVLTSGQVLDQSWTRQ